MGVLRAAELRESHFGYHAQHGKEENNITAMTNNMAAMYFFHFNIILLVF